MTTNKSGGFLRLLLRDTSSSVAESLKVKRQSINLVAIDKRDFA
jgi:hypothetical protein